MIRLTRGTLEQRLAVADLTTKEGLATFRALLDGLMVSVVYSDPPWNPGNEKFWRRHARASASVGYDALLDGWCRCVVACKPEHVFVEQSVNPKHKQMLLDAIARCSGWRLPFLEEWTVEYGNPRRPNALLHFGHEKLTTNPSGMNGIRMTREVFRGLTLRPGTAVADPCMGLGTTSRVANEFGLSCIGTELNAERLERTVAQLVKLGYVEATAPSETASRTERCPSTASVEERIETYNRTMREMRALLADVTNDPACFPQLVRVDRVESNDYNPNRTASTEMDLLEQSIRADGITMPVVVVGDTERCTVVDGFHRRTVAAERLGRKWLPCSFISSSLADRMASTVRHNRARGKHQVELMASLVKSMMALGWDDDRIAQALGMSVEELLRLRQMAGAARMMAASEYSRSWGLIEGRS